MVESKCEQVHDGGPTELVAWRSIAIFTLASVETVCQRERD